MSLTSSCATSGKNAGRTAVRSPRSNWTATCLFSEAPAVCTGGVAPQPPGRTPLRGVYGGKGQPPTLLIGAPPARPCEAPARGGNERSANVNTQHGAGARLPAGVSVGHWTDAQGQTGCTVVLVPDGAVAGVDVRGGAPGTINTDGLRPGTVTERAHAILLTGGSTFGLAAASGVLRYFEERSIGLMFGTVAVPIVAGAVIFDLLAGDPTARPGPEAGYAACEAATTSPAPGAVGAGTGASVAKAGGNEPRPGGVGLASAEAGGAVVPRGWWPTASAGTGAKTGTGRSPRWPTGASRRR